LAAKTVDQPKKVVSSAKEEENIDPNVNNFYLFCLNKYINNF
jgi:hypothetical protein